MRKVTLFLTMLLCSTERVDAQQRLLERPAIEVLVNSPDGRPVAEVLVKVLSAGTQRVLDEGLTDIKGRISFFRIGWEMFDVQVGGNQCGSVRTLYLRSDWPSVTRVVITYGFCGGFQFPQFSRLLVRFVATDGKPVESVVLKTPEDLPIITSGPSDRDGIIKLAFGWREWANEIVFDAVKPGFLPAKIHHKPWSGNDGEITIVLARE
jgi:hypothetical protein